MASIFSPSGPVGSNISDYTSLPNAPGMQGMGPIASGEQYGQFLKSQQPGFFSQLGSGLKGAGEAYKNVTKNLQTQQQMQFMPMQQMQRPSGPLQQVDLLSLLRNLGGY